MAFIQVGDLFQNRCNQICLSLCIDSQEIVMYDSKKKVSTIKLLETNTYHIASKYSYMMLYIFYIHMDIHNTFNIQHYVTMFHGFYHKNTTMFCQPTSHRPTIPSRADLQCHHAMPLAAETVVFVFLRGRWEEIALYCESCG